MMQKIMFAGKESFYIDSMGFPYNKVVILYITDVQLYYCLEYSPWSSKGI